MTYKTTQQSRSHFYENRLNKDNLIKYIIIEIYNIQVDRYYIQY